MSSEFRKSSYSSNTGQCIEAGANASGVLVRDTKDNGRGPVLRVSTADWQRFTASLR